MVALELWAVLHKRWPPRWSKTLLFSHFFMRYHQSENAVSTSLSSWLQDYSVTWNCKSMEEWEERRRERDHPNSKNTATFTAPPPRCIFWLCCVDTHWKYARALELRQCRFGFGFSRCITSLLIWDLKNGESQAGTADNGALGTGHTYSSARPNWPPDAHSWCHADIHSCKTSPSGPRMCSAS